MRISPGILRDIDGRPSAMPPRSFSPCTSPCHAVMSEPTPPCSSPSKSPWYDHHLRHHRHAPYPAARATAIERTPRGPWHPDVDIRILLSLREASLSVIDTTPLAFRLLPRQDSTWAMAGEDAATTTDGKHFDALTLADIEALPELPGASGRRQSSAYRFREDCVIKLSPHRNLVYEARALAHVRRACPSIPVPAVYGVREMHDASGRVWFCMLMEYIDGVRADEATSDWEDEEMNVFLHAVQGLRRTLATATARCIQAMPDADDHGSPGQDALVGLELSVQDELFDHIWQPMDRGPFATEADFLASVGSALQRRGSGTARLGLITGMLQHLQHLSRPCPGGAAVFSLQHANLTLGNLLVRRAPPSTTPEIVGVLGWGQSGFYPPWWELAKMASSEDELLADLAAHDDTFVNFSPHVGTMMHVRDVIY